MTCEFEVKEADLRQALAAIERAKVRGFTDTTAILRIVSVNPDGTDVVAGYDGHVVLRAHPSDPSKNWGNTHEDHIDWGRCKDGLYINTYEGDKDGG